MSNQASRTRPPTAKTYQALSMRELSALARTRDYAACWELTDRIEGVIRREVSKSLRNQPRPNCLDEQDLVSEAKIEVARAMERWDAGEGEPLHLAKYAGTVTRRSVRDQLAANSTVSVDSTTHRHALDYDKQAKRFAEERGREPELSELAALVGKSVRVVERGLNSLKAPVSLDQTCDLDEYGENRGRIYEPADNPDLIPDVQLESKDLVEVAMQGFSELPPRQRLMLSRLWGMDGQPPMTVKEVQRSLKISQHQYRKEYWAAIVFLRARVRN